MFTKFFISNTLRAFQLSCHQQAGFSPARYETVEQVGWTKTIMMTGIAELFAPTAPPGRVAGILALSYILGSFTTGYYLVRWRLRQDIRETGSGNVGARNVARLLGTPGFAVTSAGDFLKGALAVWIALNFSHDSRLAGLSLLAVVIGHVWPVQLGFRGGKGAATSLGALAMYDFHLLLAFGILFALFLATLRRFTLAGLFAFACLPLAALYLAPEPGRAIIISLLTVIVLLAHRKNLLGEFSSRPFREKIEPPNE
jgi:glycerol-3-phosphate acyltransferase PlsY